MSKLDGYWLRMGHMAVDTLTNEAVIPASLSAEAISALAEYFGGLLENAYEMGIKLGEARGRFAAAYRASGRG